MVSFYTFHNLTFLLPDLSLHGLEQNKGSRTCVGSFACVAAALVARCKMLVNWELFARNQAVDFLMLTLYHSPISPNSRRVWITLLEKDLSLNW